MEGGPVATSSSEGHEHAERHNNLGHGPGQPALKWPLSSGVGQDDLKVPTSLTQPMIL